MTAAAFEIRRENLRRLVLDKFDGNRAAFSRAASVHQNQVNLLLTDNGLHRRNLGEALARKMEGALVLPSGYLDIAHSQDAEFVVSALDIPEAVKDILRPGEHMSGITYYVQYLRGLDVTAYENLRLCAVASAEMAPDLAVGENVLVDAGVRGISVDGVYVLSRGSNYFLRRVTRQMDSSWLISSPNPAYKPMSVTSIKGIKVAARILWVSRQSAP